MKFLRTFFIVVLTSLLICTGLSLWMLQRSKSGWNFRLPENKNILVIGNSMTADALNDTILDNWANLSFHAAYYLHSTGVLDNVLRTNPQIDTVVIGVGLPAMCFRFSDEDFDNLDYPSVQRFADRMALCDKDEIRYYLRSGNLLPFMLVSALYDSEMTHDLGSYYWYDAHEVHKAELRYEKDVETRGTTDYSEQRIRADHSIQVFGLQRLMDICRRHGRVCVLLHTPAYRIDRYYNDAGYRSFLGSLGDSVLIADYVNFQMPDTSYYADVHHLNYLGAGEFSRHLKKHGLKAAYMIDYNSVNENR